MNCNDSINVGEGNRKYYFRESVIGMKAQGIDANLYERVQLGFKDKLVVSGDITEMF